MQLPEHLFPNIEEEGLKAFREEKWNAVDKVIMFKRDIVGDDYEYEGGAETKDNQSISHQTKDLQKFLKFGSSTFEENVQKSGIDFLSLTEQ